MVTTKQEIYLNRYYNIAKFLFGISPFVGIAYIMTKGMQMAEGDISTILLLNPNLTILFLICMINPFIAYLLIFIHRKLKEGDPGYAIVNLVLLLISECMLENFVYALLIGVLLFKTSRIYQVTISEAFASKRRNCLLKTISGSIIILVLTSFCLFAQIRLR